MILVDVYVPSLDKTYDFNLDENAAVKIVIDEIAEMIGQKEHTALAGNVADLFLCDCIAGRPLSMNDSLRAAGMRNGSRLLLV